MYTISLLDLLPSDAGRVVAMTSHQGDLYVAMEHGRIYRIYDTEPASTLEGDYAPEHRTSRCRTRG